LKKRLNRRNERKESLLVFLSQKRFLPFLQFLLLGRNERKEALFVFLS